MYLNNLGNALQNRFERTGSMDDLDRAIMTNEQAVESTLDDHPNHAGMSQQFGERTTEPIREDGIDGRPRSCDRDEGASRRIDTRWIIPIVPIVLQQFGDCTAKPIREDRIDGRSRSCDHDKRAGCRIDPRSIIPIVQEGSTIWGSHCRADSRGRDRWTTSIVRS